MQFTQTRAHVKFTFDATGEFRQFGERLLINLHTPNIEAIILRRALAEVILPVIRDAYIRGLPKAVNMRKVEDTGLTGKDKWTVKSTPRQNPSPEGESLLKLYERMRSAAARGDEDALNTAKADLAKHTMPFATALQRDAKGKMKKRHGLSSGHFRKRAIQVMDLFANPAHMNAVSTEGKVTVGIGNFRQLENIETPSATEFKLGLNKTRSRDNILWRHLEFGTGVHANKENGLPNRKQSNGRFGVLAGAQGMWYYGRSLKRARLVLEGSDGVHAIYGNKQLVDAQRRFGDVVAHYLTRLFSGDSI